MSGSAEEKPPAWLTCPLCRSRRFGPSPVEVMTHMRAHSRDAGWPTLRTLAAALGPDLLPPAGPAEELGDVEEKPTPAEADALRASNRSVHAAHSAAEGPGTLAGLVDAVADARRLCPASMLATEEDWALPDAVDALPAAYLRVQGLHCAQEAFAKHCQGGGVCRSPKAEAAEKAGKDEPSRRKWLFWVCWLGRWALAVLRRFYYSAKLRAETVVGWALSGIPPSSSMSPRLRAKLTRALAQELRFQSEEAGERSLGQLTRSIAWMDAQARIQDKRAAAQDKREEALDGRRVSSEERDEALDGGAAKKALDKAVKVMTKRLVKISIPTVAAADKVPGCLAVVHCAASVLPPGLLDHLVLRLSSPASLDPQAVDEEVPFGPKTLRQHHIDFISQAVVQCKLLVQQSYPKAELDAATLLAWAVEGPPSLPRSAKAKLSGKAKQKDQPEELAKTAEAPLEKPPLEKPLEAPLVKLPETKEPSPEVAAESSLEGPAEWETVSKRTKKAKKTSCRLSLRAPSKSSSSPKAPSSAPPTSAASAASPAPPRSTAAEPPSAEATDGGPELRGAEEGTRRPSLLEHLGYDEELEEPEGLRFAYAQLTAISRRAQRSRLLCI